MRTTLKICFICAATALLPRPSLADTLTLRNGDRLTGTLDGFSNGMVTFSTDYSGTLKIAPAKVAGITTTMPVTVKFKQGGYATGRLQYGPGGSMRLITTKAGTTSAIPLADVVAISPGTDLPGTIHWKGSVNIGATRHSGATSSQAVHVDASTVGRGDKDRIRLNAELNREETDGTSTQNDYKLFGQYDRFVSKKTFLYTNAKFEKNRPQNVKFRTTLGVGGGRQIFDSDRLKLSVEAGPSYVNEDVYTGQDQSYPAGRWAVHFDYYVLKRQLDFFHRHEGNYALNGAGLLVDSSTGLRYLMGHGLTLTARADIDYDSKPAPAVAKTDRTYLVLLGYQW